MRRHARILGLALVCAVGIACDESLSDIAGPTPNLEPSFAAIQRDIFEATDSNNARRACVQCHNDNGTFIPGNLNLESAVAYDNLVGVNSTQRPSRRRVDPGNPDGSYLIHKLEGGPDIGGVRMPLNSQPLSSGQISIIRRWIENGAPRN